MITITILQDHEDAVGFHCIGHSGYAEAGSDIICAGVSALVINTINSIETFTEDSYHIDTEETSGLIDYRVDQKARQETPLRMMYMLLG